LALRSPITQDYNSAKLPEKLIPEKEANREGLGNFIIHKTSLIFAVISGLGLVSLVVYFTVWFGTQTAFCPDWAINCQVKDYALWINHRLPLIQGIFSIIHGIRPALLAYAAYLAFSFARGRDMAYPYQASIRFEIIRLVPGCNARIGPLIDPSGL
jgi:hypothetical protein